MCTMFYAGPSGYPSKLKIVNQTSTYVTFQWNHLECDQENGPITGYEYRAYYDLFQYTEGTLNQNTTTYTIYDADILAFSVAAINEAGIGEHCYPLHVPIFFSGTDTHVYMYVMYQNTNERKSYLMYMYIKSIEKFVHGCVIFI